MYRYREGRYPDNMEKLTISNASPIVCHANFCFEQDINASTFLLDPPGMVLQPGQSKVCLFLQSITTPVYKTKLRS